MLLREKKVIYKPESGSCPEWTLENDQCKCCPLEADAYPHCPVAVNLAGLVEAFKDVASTENCLVRCKTPDRTYVKEMAVQEGLFSIFGIVMATSDCPEMTLFKPMARFHLPFANVDETVFRFMAAYFFRQYFEYKDGKNPDFDLTRLHRYFKVMEEVNDGILSRHMNASKQDADKNAIITLPLPVKDGIHGGGAGAGLPQTPVYIKNTGP